MFYEIVPYRINYIIIIDIITVAEEVTTFSLTSSILSKEELTRTGEYVTQQESSKQACQPVKQFILVMVAVTVFVLLGIIGINIMFIYNHSGQVASYQYPEYLLLPSNSTFTLPVDPSMFSALEFFFANTSIKDETTVKFILTSNDFAEGFVASNFITSGQVCNLERQAIGDNCLIARYWPELSYPNGSISCESTI